MGLYAPGGRVDNTEPNEGAEMTSHVPARLVYRIGRVNFLAIASVLVPGTQDAMNSP